MYINPLLNTPYWAWSKHVLVEYKTQKPEKTLQYFNYDEYFVNDSKLEKKVQKFAFYFRSNEDSSRHSISSDLIARVSCCKCPLSIPLSMDQKKTIDDYFDKRGFPIELRSIIMEYVEHVDVLFDCNNVIRGT